jgi:competence protein ComEC
MNSVAVGVAAIPGAIWRLPDIPVAAFALMIGGGLWLILWSTSWRLLGLGAIIAGVVLAPFEPRPDIVIGRDGNALAYRQPNGNLGVIAPSWATFDATRWLEHDGDERTLALAKSETNARCDRAACTASLAGGRTLTHVLHPSALAEDCPNADILIAAMRLPTQCDRTRRMASPTHDAIVTRITIDPSMLTQRNVVTVLLTGKGAIFTTSNDQRAARPWGAAAMPGR